MTNLTREQVREAELDVIASSPEETRPLLLVCPHCLETEPHTRFRVYSSTFGKAGPWLLVCWGCDHLRPETAE